MPSQPLYISVEGLPYSAPDGVSIITTALNTYDLYLPRRHIPHPECSYWVIFIHGGGFRDPENTSRDILPTIGHVFDPASPWYCNSIRGIASVNYRLSPYPNHATNPSKSDDRSRNVQWPVHLKDVSAAIELIMDTGEDARENLLNAAGKIPEGPGPKDTRTLKERKYILAGHSVGATLALKIAEMFKPNVAVAPPKPLAVIGLAGIYNFPACRDAHPADAALYTEIFNGAFGLEEAGAWEQGRTPRFCFAEDTKVVVLVSGVDDALVEKEQILWVAARIRELNSGRSLILQPGTAPGGHDDLLTGDALARSLDLVDKILVQGTV